MIHESASIGYRLKQNVSFLFTVDHMSNASVCDANPGPTDAGARLAYMF
jgi:lipid A 3-O-deacylase